MLQVGAKIWQWIHNRLFNTTKNIFFAIILPLLSFNTHAENSTDTVLGYWANESSILHIQQSANTLTATVFAIRDPLYLADEDAGIPGMPRRDDQNSDETLRSRPIIGLNLLSEYKYGGKRWEGKIYDPESGNIYSSRMERDGENLKMRGYIGVPWVGRTAIFEPLSKCTLSMRELLEKNQQSSADCTIKK